MTFPVFGKRDSSILKDDGCDRDSNVYGPNVQIGAG